LIADDADNEDRFESNRYRGKTRYLAVSRESESTEILEYQANLRVNNYDARGSIHANLIIGPAPTMHHPFNEIRIVIAIDFGAIIAARPEYIERRGCFYLGFPDLALPAIVSTSKKNTRERGYTPAVFTSARGKIHPIGNAYVCIIAAHLRGIRTSFASSRSFGDGKCEGGGEERRRRAGNWVIARETREGSRPDQRDRQADRER